MEERLGASEAGGGKQDVMNPWNETFDLGTAADGSRLCREDLFHVLTLLRMGETLTDQIMPPAPCQTGKLSPAVGTELACS